MSSTWQLNEHSEGELKVTVGGDDWKKAQKKSFKKLAKKVNLPGFRPGQAPEALVKKYVSQQNIMMDAIDEIAPNELVKAIEEHSLEIIARPQLDVEKIDGDEVTLKFMITVKPEVKLGDYKGLGIKKDEANVTEEDIDAEVKKLQERFADMVIKEEGEAVENGDVAVLDFEGFKEGVAFEGGKGENYPLEIGSGAFIPGFEEQIVGMKAEETKDIDVTFPQEYQAEELAGAAVVFKVTVHEIKKKELPAVDDELIKQAEIENVETVEAYREHVRADLKAKKENDAENKFTDEILTKICDGSSVEIPTIMIEDETDRMVKDFDNRLRQQGFTLEQFQQVTGQDDEAIRREIGKDAEQKVNVRLVLEAIAAEEKIEVSDEEVEAELQKIADTYKMEIDEVKKLIQNDAISYDLRIRKTMDLIKEAA